MFDPQSGEKFSLFDLNCRSDVFTAKIARIPCYFFSVGNCLPAAFICNWVVEKKLYFLIEQHHKTSLCMRIIELNEMT